MSLAHATTTFYHALFLFIFSALWSAAAPLYSKGLSRPSKKAVVEVTAKRATRDLAIKMANLKVWQSCHGCQKIQKKWLWGGCMIFLKFFFILKAPLCFSILCIFFIMKMLILVIYEKLHLFSDFFFTMYFLPT